MGTVEKQAGKTNMFVYRIVGNGIYFAIIKKEVGFEFGC